MATKKQAVAKEDKFENQDFPLFEAIAALDKKDYGYYDRLSPEQQRKFVPFMLIKWLSYVKGSSDIAGYYAMSTEYNANKYFFNEYVSKHPKLQWYMLCASSPGVGKQYHQWLPQIKERVSLLKEPAQLKDIKDYYTKIYPKANTDDVTEFSKAFVQEQKKKMYLAEIYPHLKIADIEVLSQTVTDEDITQYEKDRGNR
jgi:hypothetical protein